MEAILKCIDDVKVYIDDVGIFSLSWEDHIMRTLDFVCERLRLKCKWAIEETDWLGYWLTPKGLKPWDKKIKAIQQMQRPQNIKQLRSFIGSVNFYRHMWPHRAEILAPLTSCVGKKHLV